MAEKILRTEYSEEMQRSYMNYSMSVITARAIPDARDGLKPVQRRVLYDMRELHLDHEVAVAVALQVISCVLLQKISGTGKLPDAVHVLWKY